MYNTYEFIYDGVPSSMYGLFICDFGNNSNADVPFGNQAEIVERKIRGRVAPLHYGVDYTTSPLSFNVVFGASHELDRWEMQDIANWLTGRNDYAWFSVEQCDMINLHYKCIITSLTPISVGWAPYAFEASFRCDCPYAYGDEFILNFNTTAGGTNSITNDGTAREPCRPLITINKPTGVTEFQISSNFDRKGIKLSKLPSKAMQIEIDNKNGIIIDKTDGSDLYAGFNDNFFKLYPGLNVITTSKAMSVSYKGRFYFNAGA